MKSLYVMLWRCVSHQYMPTILLWHGSSTWPGRKKDFCSHKAVVLRGNLSVQDSTFPTQKTVQHVFFIWERVRLGNVMQPAKMLMKCLIPGIPWLCVGKECQTLIFFFFMFMAARQTWNKTWVSTLYCWVYSRWWHFFIWRQKVVFLRSLKAKKVCAVNILYNLQDYYV